MSATDHELQPYVGPRPFEDEDLDRERFFGRDFEASELLSLVTAHAVVLLYAQSGAGKTSMINAKLAPLLKAQRFDVLPPARVQGAPRSSSGTRNEYIHNVLTSWANPSDLAAVEGMSLAGYLKTRPRLMLDEDQPTARIAIFDQFEELFTSSLDRPADRRDLIVAISDALEGSPTLLQPESVIDAPAFCERLQEDRDPSAAYLRARMQPDAVQRLREVNPSSDELRTIVAHELNRVIQNALLYRGPAWFQPPIDPTLLAQLREQHERRLPRLNRLLLEAMFAGHFVRSVEGDPLLRVLLVIREDFLAELDTFAPLLPERLRIRFRLERLGAPAALDAIRKPVEKLTSRRFAPTVAEQLVTDLMKTETATADGARVTVSQEFVEPVQLQVVCDRLWRELPADTVVITDAHIRRFGNVDKALSDFYERCLAEVAARTAVNEPVLRRWFQEQMITPAGTRGTVFRGKTDTAELPNAVVDVLEKLHLIRREVQRGATWYEITHDRFIGPILESNRRWIASRAWADQIRARLRGAAAAWSQSGHRSADLMDGVALLEAERWLNSPEAVEVGVPEEVRAFIQASRALIDDREEAKKIQQLRSRVGVLAVLLVVMIGLAMMAFMQFNNAQKQAKLAERERLQADQARQQAEGLRQQAEAARNVASDNESRAKASANDAKQALNQKERALSEKEKALFEKDEALRKKDEAEKIAVSRELATKASQRVQDDPRLAISLAAEAFRISPTVEAEETLRMSLAESNQLAVLLGHTQTVNQALFSRDGRYLLTDSEDATARLWDAVSGAPLATLRGHKAAVHAIAVNDAGTLAATEAADSSVRVWEIPGGRPLLTIPEASGPVATLAFTPDGGRLATETTLPATAGKRPGAVLVWDVTTRPGSDKAEELKTSAARLQLTGPADGISSLDFSRDGRFLAAGSRDRTVRIWNLETGRESVAAMSHPAEVTAVHFSPDGQRLMVLSNASPSECDIEESNGRQPSRTGRTGTAHLWNPANGQQVTTLTGHTDLINSAVFSADGNRIVTASSDKTARVWDANSFRTLAILTGHSDSVCRASFSVDGKWIVTASRDGTARIWSTETGAELVTLRGHTGIVKDARISPDGRRVATAGRDSTVRLWNATASGQLSQLNARDGTFRRAAWSPDGASSIIVTGPPSRPEPPPPLRPIQTSQLQLWDVATGARVGVIGTIAPTIDSVAFSPNGQLLATTNLGDTVSVWNIRGGSVELKGHKAKVYQVTFSGDGRYVASASADNTAAVWEPVTGVRLRSLSGHSDEINTVQFSPNADYLVTASDDRTARIWSTQSWSTAAVIRHHSREVTNATFSADGRRVLTVGNDGWVAVSDLTGRLLVSIRTPAGTLDSATFSPDPGSDLIATTGSDRMGRIWKSGSGQEVATLSGHTDTINSIEFSADGRWVVTASDDNTARIWDAGTGRQLRLLRGHVRSVESAHFGPDGKTVVTASLDGTSRVWDATTGTNLATIQADVLLASALSPDGARIATAERQRATPAPASEKLAAETSTFQIFNPFTGALVASLPVPEPLNDVAFGPAGQSWFASASDDNTVNIGSIDSDDRSFRVVARLRGHEKRVYKAAFSHDGRYVATASEDNTARIWSTTGQPLSSLPQGDQKRVTEIVFSPDDQFLLMTSGGSARLLESLTGRVVSLFSGHSGNITQAAFSPDGTRIVTSSEDGSARVWNARDGQLVSILEDRRGARNASVYTARFSPTGRDVVTASADNLARIWDATTGRLKISLRGHQGEVKSATFSPDGRWVLTASDDMTAQVWESGTGARVFTFKGHKSPVVLAEFSQDGARILTIGAGGPALVFTCELCKPVRDLAGSASTRGRALTVEERERYLHEPPPPAASRAIARQ